MTTRILVVDDYELWRRYVSSVVRRSLDCRVIGEAADGGLAVRDAERLEPDLIVLDVGLPTINGIDAGRRILAARPDTRIVFLSEYDSPEVAAAALQAGARGYVLKSDAAFELLPAIRRAIDGRRFVSARIAAQGPATDAGDTARRHEMSFCHDDRSLADRFAEFSRAALEEGSSAIVIATSPRLQAISESLRAAGIDLDAAIAEGRYMPSSVDETLSAFMVDGWPDEARFWKTTGALLSSAARAARGAYPAIAACGECAPTLFNEGRAAAAIRLEQLWDQLARTYDVAIHCGYVGADDDESEITHQICGLHSEVLSG